MADIYEEFWMMAIQSGGVPEGTVCKRCSYFGETPEESTNELQRLLWGEKTAVSHCIPWYLRNMQPLPKLGDYTIITDFYGNPAAVVKTVEVTLEAAPDIPRELAEKERAGGYEEWYQWRQDRNRRLAQQSGFPYVEDLGVLMEEIQVVFPVRDEN